MSVVLGQEQRDKVMMQTMSPLGTEGGSQPQGGSQPPETDGLLDGLSEQHSQNKAKFNKLADAKKMLDKVRVELTGLARLGDVVTQDDVIKSAAKLVTGGLAPAAVAGLLADMPENSQALQGWVQGHVQEVSQREAQLAPVLASARHQMGVSALRVLAGHHLIPQQGQPAQAAPQPAANPLTSSGGPPDAG